MAGQGKVQSKAQCKTGLGRRAEIVQITTDYFLCNNQFGAFGLWDVFVSDQHCYTFMKTVALGFDILNETESAVLKFCRLSLFLKNLFYRLFRLWLKLNVRS